MADKFEHQIADQVSGFQLTPSAEVWKGVTMELDKEKRKKPLLIWWMVLGVLGVLLVGIFLIKSLQAPRNSNDSLQKQDAQKTNAPGIQSMKDTSSTIIPLGAEKTPIQPSFNPVQNLGKLSKSIDQLQHKSLPDSSHQFHDLKTAIEKTNSLKEHSIASKPNAMQATGMMQPNDSITDVVDKSKTFINNTPNSPNTINSKDSNSSTIASTVNGVKKSFASAWKMVFAIGSTRISESNVLGNIPAADRTAFNNSSAAIVSGLPNSIAASNNGFHLELGVSKNWQFSKRWGFSTGISYRYLQNQQLVGLKKDSSYLIYGQAVSNGQAYTVNSYYQAGSQNSRNNYAHWLLLPVQIQYQLNPSSKIQWSVFGGAELSWNFASNWLLADQSNNMLYDARPLTNTIGMHLKMGVQVQNKKSQSLSLGWENSINSFSKLNQSKQYWHLLQLSFSQPIFLKKSHKK